MITSLHVTAGWGLLYKADLNEGGGCAAFLIPGQRQVRRPACCSFFECHSSFPDGYHGPGHPLVHEVSAASATPYRTDSHGQGEAMLLELMAELALALLCQSSC